MKGTCKWFNAQKGYGLIIGDDGEEYFAHYSQIQMDGFKELSDGDIVCFKFGFDWENERALAVKIEPILTLSMVVRELAKEGLHTMRICDRKGLHGWYVVDEFENPVVDKEMDLKELAAYVGISVSEGEVSN